MICSVIICTSTKIDMKKTIEKILAGLAGRIVKKYQPKIIGITGSIGKTSAKEAVAAVLSSKYRIRKNIKNYNNEIGLPLTIIGAEAQGKNIFGWIIVIIKGIKLLMTDIKDYPEVLVLEMGADKSGDIEYLINIAKPDVSVVTKVSPTHIEFFKSLDAIAREKRNIVTCLKDQDFAILNFDDDRVIKMSDKTKGHIISFGHNKGADVQAVEYVNLAEDGVIKGIRFKIQYKGSTVPAFLPHVIGKHQMNSALIGAAVGLAMDMNLVDISSGLKNYVSPKGRMNVINGFKNSLIIDDTYNSSPEAAHKAVEAVANLETVTNGRKIAFMGDMMELGDISDEEHFNLGKKIADMKFDLLVAVGTFAEKIKEGAKAGDLQNVLTFADSDLALNKVTDIIKEGDIILVKGSQGSRMEKIVKVLMAEPDKAKDLLIRQSGDWLNR